MGAYDQRVLNGRNGQTGSRHRSSVRILQDEAARLKIAESSEKKMREKVGALGAKSEYGSNAVSTVRKARELVSISVEVPSGKPVRFREASVNEIGKLHWSKNPREAAPGDTTVVYRPVGGGKNLRKVGEISCTRIRDANSGCLVDKYTFTATDNFVGAVALDIGGRKYFIKSHDDGGSYSAQKASGSETEKQAGGRKLDDEKGLKAQEAAPGNPAESELKTDLKKLGPSPLHIDEQQEAGSKAADGGSVEHLADSQDNIRPMIETNQSASRFIPVSDGIAVSPSRTSMSRERALSPVLPPADSTPVESISSLPNRSTAVSRVLPARSAAAAQSADMPSAKLHVPPASVSKRLISRTFPGTASVRVVSSGANGASSSAETVQGLRHAELEQVKKQRSDSASGLQKLPELDAENLQIALSRIVQKDNAAALPEMRFDPVKLSDAPRSRQAEPPALEAKPIDVPELPAAKPQDNAVREIELGNLEKAGTTPWESIEKRDVHPQEIDLEPRIEIQTEMRLKTSPQGMPGQSADSVTWSMPRRIAETKIPSSKVEEIELPETEAARQISESSNQSQNDLTEQLEKIKPFVESVLNSARSAFQKKQRHLTQTNTLDLADMYQMIRSYDAMSQTWSHQGFQFSPDEAEQTLEYWRDYLQQRISRGDVGGEAKEKQLIDNLYNIVNEETWQDFSERRVREPGYGGAGDAAACALGARDKIIGQFWSFVEDIGAEHVVQSLYEMEQASAYDDERAELRELRIYIESVGETGGFESDSGLPGPQGAEEQERIRKERRDLDIENGLEPLSPRDRQVLRNLT